MIELIVQEISLDENGDLKSILFEVKNDWIHHPYTATVRRGRNSGKVEFTIRKASKNIDEIRKRLRLAFMFFEVGHPSVKIPVLIKQINEMS